MVSWCLEQGIGFGVCLIKSGQEVGGPAVPFDTGTSARIINVQRLEDGRMNLLALGERRFRVQEIVQQVPYMVAVVEYLEDVERVRPGLLASVRQAFTPYLRSLAALEGGWVREANLPEDPTALSYLVGQYLVVPKPVKQRLLEAPSAEARLEMELVLLEEQTQRLKRELEQKNQFQGFRLN